MKKSMKPTLPVVTNINANILSNNPARQEADRKPVITSLVGTARVISMSKRPQPPAKPRSERPLSSRMTIRSHIHSEKGMVEKNISSTEVQHSALKTEGHLLNPSSSDGSSCGKEPGLEKNKQNVRRHRNGKLEERKIRDVQQDQMTSIASVTSPIFMMKSTSDLLEEAKAIAAEGLQQANQQMVPQETMTLTLARKRGNTALSFTSLKSQCKIGDLSSSKQLFKKLQKSDISSKECLSKKNIRSPKLAGNITDVKNPSEPRHHLTDLIGNHDLTETLVLQTAPVLYSKTETPQSSQLVDVDGLESRGGRFEAVQRPLKSSHSILRSATWTPETDSEEYKTIHHLCTTPACRILPVDLQLASRVCHTQDIFVTSPQFDQQRPTLRHLALHSDILRLVRDGIPLEQVGETEQMDDVTHLPVAPSDAIEDWQCITEYCVEKPRMIMSGHSATLFDDQFRTFWSPAPPKFSCAPTIIKEKLFPKYQTSTDPSNGNILDNLQTGEESDGDEMDIKQHTSVNNILFRKHKSKSLMDLTTEKLVPRCSSDICYQEQLQVKRSFSAPYLTLNSEVLLSMQSDFTTITRELVQAHQQQQSSICFYLDPLLSASHAQPENAEGKPDSQEQPSQELSDSTSRPHHASGRRVSRLGMRDQPIRNHRGKHRRRKGAKKLTQAKLLRILQKLMEQQETLSRSQSLCQLPQNPKVSALVRHPSLPLLLDFDSFALLRGGIPDKIPAREWVNDLWNAWFDEIIPLLEESSIKSDQEAMRTHMDASEQQESQPLKDEALESPDMIDLSERLNENQIIADLKKAVAKLTLTVTKQGQNNAFDFCRRGVLYKKLGQINQALEDFNFAISLEPQFVDAYWHRHSIFLLRNDPTSALSDLNSIIKYNNKHADAYKSRAEIYEMKGDTTLAVLNYSWAIRCKPDDDETYFKRAKLYEESREMLLAMEDYAKTFSINPTRTDALLIHGLHYFHIANWKGALESFSLLLKQEPENTKARTYRGRIFVNLGHFQEAIEDFSLAVHLDPNDWLAFYHRGCLLRKIKPHMALRDLSTSVLINDTPENISALLHRGLIYKEQQQWQQAIADFQAVTNIDRTVAVAHINLGLIYMLTDQNLSAVEMFSNALQVDPTCIKVYVCRAKAYENINDLVGAIKDVTRAIHMRPDDKHLQIMRGQYLCEMEKFNLATFCMEYVTEMNKAIGLSAVQQAAIQSFLGNSTQAISCLEEEANTQHSLPGLILLGKLQMKEQMFMEAVISFKKALSILSSSESLFKVPEASELFYLTGMCFMAQGENALLPQALNTFSKAVKINPQNAEAYFQRGLCHMRLHHSKSVQDFNRTLNINPNFFQVYIGLAAFYGGKGQYAKAVQYCNEAIRIQPDNVRAYMYRGALKYYSKVYKEAIEDLTIAIKNDKTGNPFVYYNRGVCFQQLLEYDLALQDYSTVLLLSSQKELNLKVLINRALVYVNLNDHFNSLQDFKAAVMKQPKDATLHYTLGICYHRTGQLQEAVKAYSQVLCLNPFLLDAYVGRANVFMDYGHAEANKQAQRDYLSALHLNPCFSTARIGLAYNFQVCGWFQRAWNQFTVAMEVNPKCWSAYEGRAIVSLQMGDTFAAFQDINNSLKCNPHSAQLLTNRGVINQFMGDNASAMKDYQAAISLNSRCALAFFNAANLFFYNRQFEQAREYYSRAVDLDPSDESPFLNRAITHALLRKIPESLLDFSKALSLNPQSAHVYFNRANLYCFLKKYKSAERDYTQALHLQPNDPLLYKLRADVRGHLGLTEQAVQDYKTALELQDIMQHPK